MIKTTLYDEHVKYGAKMIPFAGYYMPANYSEGIISEYKSIRENVGIFDVSHMGQIEISGKNAVSYLQYLTTNNINKMKDGSAQYNLICNHNGGIIDDVIIYRLNSEKFMIIVNASNIDKDFKWLLKENKFNVAVNNLSDQFSLIAIQGPNSRKVMNDIFDLKLENKFYTFLNKKIYNNDVLISRTGYTGELGYEILADHNTILKIWKELISSDVNPCGLAVRDTLRIEMKYCLYGNDINEDINPVEAGLSWVVDFSKNNFIGKEIILNNFENKPNKNLICFKMLEKSIPRKDYKIYFNNKKIGIVTSGTFSTNLNIGIGIGYIDNDYLYNSKTNEKLKKCFIEIRNKMFKAEIINPPFINNFSLHD